MSNCVLDQIEANIRSLTPEDRGDFLRSLKYNRPSMETALRLGALAQVIPLSSKLVTDLFNQLEERFASELTAIR